MTDATGAERWMPTHFKRLIKTYATSMGTSEVMTDAGRAYVRTYGLFPQFVPLLRRDAAGAAAARLKEMSHDVAQAVIPPIPAEWQVPPAAQLAALELVSRRAGLVADRILDQLPFGLNA